MTNKEAGQNKFHLCANNIEIKNLTLSNESVREMPLQEVKNDLKECGIDLIDCEEDPSWLVLKFNHNDKEHVKYIYNCCESDNEEEIKEANEKYKEAALWSIYPESTLCLLKDSTGKYNICRSNTDRRPIHPEWYEEYGSKKIKEEDVACLKKVVCKDLANYKAECYPISLLGKLGEMIIEKEDKTILKNQLDSDIITEKLKREGHSEEIIKNIVKPNYYFSNGKWIVDNKSSWFRICYDNKGIAVKPEEGLTEIRFDPEKKSIEFVITKVLMPHKWRVIDLSEAPKFFEELRDKIEEILLECNYTSVIPNESRTIFMVK